MTIKFVLAKIFGRLIIFFLLYFTHFWAFEKMFPQQKNIYLALQEKMGYHDNCIHVTLCNTCMGHSNSRDVLKRDIVILKKQTLYFSI